VFEAAFTFEQVVHIPNKQVPDAQSLFYVHTVESQYRLLPAPPLLLHILHFPEIQVIDKHSESAVQVVPSQYYPDTLFEQAEQTP